MASITRRVRTINGKMVERWRARVHNPDGEPRQIERMFRRKAEAEAWAKQIEFEIMHGDLVPRTKAERPFTDVADEWLKASRKAVAKTKVSYRSILDVHVLPYFGQRAISAIEHGDVQRFVSALEVTEKHAPMRGLPKGTPDGPRPTLSANTIRNVYRVLNGVMRYAVKAGYVRANPCADVDLPRDDEPQEMIVLDRAEMRALLDAIPSEWRLPVMLAAYSGARAGEIWGLRREAIDLGRGEIRIVTALKEINGRTEDGPTKNRKRRLIDIPAPLREPLREHLATRPDDPKARVFVRPSGPHAGEDVAHTTFYRRVYRPAVARCVEAGTIPAAKAGVRFHDLRHSVASLLLARGIDVKSVQDLLGHSSASVTADVYQHLLPEVRDRRAKALDTLLDEPDTDAGE